MKVHQACAECLEKAGGRQNTKRIPWSIGLCGACGKRKAVTAPKHFGSPRLTQSIMEDVLPERSCKRCGCTENDCRICIERTGQPCHWVAPDLCSACQRLDDVHPTLRERTTP